MEIDLYLDGEGLVNGSPVTLDVPPHLVNGRVLIPLRFVSEIMGMEVKWDEATSTVLISGSVLDWDARASTGVSPTPIVRAGQLSVKEIVAAIQPAVVYIEPQRCFGSGFLISASGEVVTNAHVGRGSKWIYVITSKGEKYPATLFKINNAWDIAILKIDAPNVQFPYLKSFAHSDEVSVGDDVLVFGNPYGLVGTVTKGIISSKRMWSPSDAWEPPIEVIQYDATTAPGSSGGPAINMYAEVVGIHFSGLAVTDELNFAIPADVYYLVSQQPPYSLRDDYYSFWTENWDWLNDVSNINAEVADILKSSDIGFSSARIQIEYMPKLFDTWDTISSYYPQYPEVENLRQLLLAALGYNYKLFSLVTSPNMFSSQTIEELANQTRDAYERFNQEMNRLRERFSQ